VGARAKKIIWIVAIFAVVTVATALLIMPKGGDDGGGGFPASKAVTNAELRDLVSKGARLIDVRTSLEFAGGHIEGAENVPVEGIAATSAGWDKNQPVVLYCESGARSRNAAQYLAGQGFTKVYDLTSGFGAWDGAVVQGEASQPATSVASGDLPIMYEFYTDT
jgi:phage shock protein E